jgi:type IX secretion system PorP/SprF family membrane protein
MKNNIRSMKNFFTIQNALLTICFMIVMQSADAQTDPHFTQNYTYPMYINPAMTGSSDGEYRVSAVYRTQWGSLGNPYRTTGISFDARTNSNIALGVNLMNQSAGDGGFNYFNTYASIAYAGVKFGRNDEHRIIFAMQAGLINRHVDPMKFKWGEQWNPITGYSASNPTTESFNTTSATTLDMGTGVLYYDASADKKANVFGGVSFFHINKPSDPIVATQSVALNTIPLRYTVHGGVSLKISDGVTVVPHALYMHQGNASETTVGIYLQKHVNDETDIMAGSYYRYKDAVAPFLAVDYKNLLVGVSYDANTSKLGSMAKNINSFELSLTYTKRNGTKSIFDFIHCPRL